MLKQNNLFIGAAIVALMLLTGCSESDGYSTSTTGSWTPDTEVIVINGHTLPPEPDRAINNASLLGVDSNDNGVRDDVEIWIYKKYENEHPIHIDIAMQAGRAWQKVLEDPIRAKEIYPIVDAAIDCEGYYKNCARDLNETVFIIERTNNRNFKELVFNTEERETAFWQYNKSLSGDSYSIPRCSERKQLCDFNTSKYDK